MYNNYSAESTSLLFLFKVLEKSLGNILNFSSNFDYAIKTHYQCLVTSYLNHSIIWVVQVSMLQIITITRAC